MLSKDKKERCPAFGSRVVSAVNKSLLVWGFICLGLLTACGYKVSGRGELPGGVQTIDIQVLENRSSETGVEITITNALTNELNRRRQGSVAQRDKADARLSGTIESLTWDTVSRTGINTASERKVYAKLSLTLTDKSGNVLWKRIGLRGEQAYVVVAGDKAATDRNRRIAIDELSEKMAEYVYRSLTDNF